MWAAHPEGQRWDHQKPFGPFSSPLLPTHTQIWHKSWSNSSDHSIPYLPFLLAVTNCIQNVSKAIKTDILLISSSHSSWLKSAGSQDGVLHCHNQLTSCFSLRHASGGKEKHLWLLWLPFSWMCFRIYLQHSAGTCVSLDSTSHENMNDTLFKTNSAWVKWHRHLEIWELSQICFQCVDGRVDQLLMEVLPQNITVLQRRQDDH